MAAHRQISIRPYEPADWPALCRVHDTARLHELRQSVGEAAFLTLAQAGEAEGLFDGAIDVLVLDEEIVGFVGYSNDELTWLYVHPKQFRQGHGRTLLRHAMNAAGPVFRTEVLEGNEPATRLYLAEGFKVTARKEGRLAGNESFPAVGLLLEHRREAVLPCQ